VAVVFGVSGAAALMTGRPLIWPPEEITLSEAVALRDRGEVVRQIMLGMDPNRRYETHDVFRDDEDVALTPLEAAVITRERYMVALVLEYGASLNDQNSATLQCLATNVRDESIRRYLADLSRDVDCAGVELPWHLN
jgi:hypothetical protein